MSGPEGLGPVDTPLPLARFGVTVVVFHSGVRISDACDRPTTRSGGLTRSDQCSRVSSNVFLRVFLSYRLDTAAAPNNRRGGTVYPLTIMRLKVLRRCIRRGKPWHPNTTLPLSTAVAWPLPVELNP
eukprot:6213629-Pleurochrysis_carterae.AAC.3